MRQLPLKRVFSGWRIAALATFLAFLLLCFQGAVASSDTSTENFYARAGAGVFFLDMSESSPFIRTNGREEVVGFLDHYDADFEDGTLVNFAVGKKFDPSGKISFAEWSGFFTSYTSRHVSEYSEDPAPWADVRNRFQEQSCPGGIESEICLTAETEQYLVALIENDPQVRSVGWIGKIDGGAMPFGSPNFAWGDPIRIRTKREVDFYGLDLVAGTLAKQTDRTLFFIGPSFKRLDQETGTFAYESNRPSSANNLTLKEDLEASYYGAVIGTRMDVPFRERWHFMLDGRLGMYYLDSEYHGSQRTLLTTATPVLDVSTDLKTSDSEFATTLSLQASLSVTTHDRLTFRIGTGVEYLSHAPKMRYASLGESFASGDPHAPARIRYSDAFGVFSTVSAEIRM